MNSHTSQRKIKYAQPLPQKVSISRSRASFHPHLGPPRVLLGLEGVGHKDTVVAFLGLGQAASQRPSG